MKLRPLSAGKYFINYFRSLKKSVVLFVFFAFTLITHAGSYEDFFTAIKRDDARSLHTLLLRGFDPNTLDENAQHGLFLALREPSPAAAEALLLGSGIDVNYLNAQGESPLMMAALRGQDALVERLISRGADVNKTGWTPLHYAATHGHLKIIGLLLENHAFIDPESPNGTTPLMMAAQYGTIEAVKLLLEEGAEPLLKNQLGLTAIDFAQRANRPDAVELITAAARKKQAPWKW
jgi:uncharacterized protein